MVFSNQIVWGGFASLQTSLLCIVVEVEGGGSVTMTVGVSDRLKVTGDGMQHVTHDS